MEADTDLAAGTTDRRTALKKAAAAAGVVAWTTPAVQVLSSGTAHAQAVTGCAPMLTVLLKETGEGTKGGDCECVRVLPARCCSNNTSFPFVTATCGATCGGAGTIVGDILITPQLIFKCKTPPDVSVELSCNNIPAGLTVSATVKCADGSSTLVSAMGTEIKCTPCAGIAAAPAIVPELDVSTVDSATMTSTEPARPPTESPTVEVTTATTATTEPAPPPTDDSAP